MTRCAWLMALGSLALAAAVAASPDLLEWAVPEAHTLVGINLEGTGGSKLAEAFRAQAVWTAPALGESLRLLAQELLGEAREMLLASVREHTGHSNLLVMRSAPGADLTERVKTRAGCTRPAAQAGRWLCEKDGKAIMLWTPADEVLVVGDPELVQRAGARPSASTELSLKARELRREFDIWGVSKLPSGEWAEGVASQEVASVLKGDLLRSVVLFAGGARVAPETRLVLSAVSRTEQDAENLARALQFFTGLLEAHQAGRDPLAVNLQQQGRTVTVSLALATEQAEALLEKFGAFGRKPVGSASPDAVGPPRQRKEPQ